MTDSRKNNFVKLKESMLNLADRFNLTVLETKVIIGGRVLIGCVYTLHVVEFNLID